MISRPNPLPGPSVDPQERWISLCVDSLYPQMKPWIQSVLDNDYFLSRRYAVVITYFFATCVQYQMVTCARGRLFAWVWMVRAQEHHVTRQNVIPTNRLTICHSQRCESPRRLRCRPRATFHTTGAGAAACVVAPVHVATRCASVRDGFFAMSRITAMVTKKPDRKKAGFPRPQYDPSELPGAIR